MHNINCYMYYKDLLVVLAWAFVEKGLLWGVTERAKAEEYKEAK